MLIRNGVIDYVGTNQGAEDMAATSPTWCRTIDLQGTYSILPGFHDVHMHPMEVGNPVAGTCMMPSNTLPTDPKMWKAFEEGCEYNQLGTDWILGWGHSISSMLEYLKQEDSVDPKYLLDEWVLDYPVVIMEETSHSAWVNSEALRRAGIDGVDPQAPVGGRLMLNEFKECNGIILENAVIWIMNKAFNQTLYPELPSYAVEGLQYGLEQLAKNGITSFVDARVYWGRGNEEAYEKVEKAGEMTARANLAMWAYLDIGDDYQIEKLKSFYDNPKDGMVKRTMIKVGIYFVLSRYFRGTSECLSETTKLLLQNSLGLPGWTYWDTYSTGT